MGLKRLRAGAQYEGPGPTRIDGEMYFPSHVQVPKVLVVIIIVDDKMRRRALSGTQADPAGEHRIEWRKAPPRES
jgi:hypothetical protein